MVEAPFLLIRAALPHMYAQRFGRIINISSVHGLRASEFKVAYVTAKHALEGLSKVTALEARPARCDQQLRQPGLRPNAAGDQADRRPGHDARHPRGSGRGEILLKESAIKRLVEPEEVAVAGGLAGLTARGHGDRRVVHDGRRVERPMTDAHRSGSRRKPISRTPGSPTSPGSCSSAPAHLADYRSLWQWSVDDPTPSGARCGSTSSSVTRPSACSTDARCRARDGSPGAR